MTDAKFLNLRRREFLAAGSAGILSTGIGIPKMAFAADLVGDLPAPGAWGGEMVSIGYWRGSDAITDFGNLMHSEELLLEEKIGENETQIPVVELADLVPAQSLGRGDPAFVGKGAQVRIHGVILESSGRATSTAALSIDVHYSPYHETVFQAWSYRPGALSNSSSTGFVVPIDRDGGLTLTFGIGDPLDSRSNSVEACATQCLSHFTPGQQTSLPKLKRGVYLAAWRGANAEAKASWKQLQMLVQKPAVDADSDSSVLPQQQCHLVRRGEGKVDSELLFVMFSVDYATAESTLLV